MSGNHGLSVGNTTVNRTENFSWRWLSMSFTARLYDNSSSLHSGWNLWSVWCFDLNLEEIPWMNSVAVTIMFQCMLPTGEQRTGDQKGKTHLGGGFLRSSWRDGSMAKNACCSCRRWAPGSSQLPVTSAPGDLTHSSGLWKGLYTHSHIDTYANI